MGHHDRFRPLPEGGSISWLSMIRLRESALKYWNAFRGHKSSSQECKQALKHEFRRGGHQADSCLCNEDVEARGSQVLAGAGAVDHDELVDMAKSKFSDLPSSGISTADLIKQVQPPMQPPPLTTSRVHYDILQYFDMCFASTLVVLPNLIVRAPIT